MDIKSKAGASLCAALVKRPPARSLATAALLGLGSLGVARLAAADESPHRGWWFDFGLGAASLSSGRDAPVSGSSTWVDGVIGGRLNDRWLMGLELGGTATSASSDDNSANMGGTLSHALLAIRYLPKVDHGWVWGLGAGPVYYNNAAAELFTGQLDSGSGWAGNVAVGYDWKLGHGKSHLEALLNIEQGRISLSTPFTGQFSYTTVAASVHIASF